MAAISPPGLLVSMSRSARCSAHPSRLVRSIKPAPSTTERLNLSNLATNSPAAFPPRTASRAAYGPAQPGDSLARAARDPSPAAGVQD